MMDLTWLDEEGSKGAKSSRRTDGLAAKSSRSNTTSSHTSQSERECQRVDGLNESSWMVIDAERENNGGSKDIYIRYPLPQDLAPTRSRARPYYYCLSSLAPPPLPPGTSDESADVAAATTDEGALKIDDGERAALVLLLLL